MQIKTTCRFQLTSVRKHIIKNKQPGSARWYTSVIPALRRQKEEHKFKGSLDYVTLFERKREREREKERERTQNCWPEYRKRNPYTVLDF
jgi:hypothetical protein